MCTFNACISISYNACQITLRLLAHEVTVMSGGGGGEG